MEGRDLQTSVCTACWDIQVPFKGTSPFLGPSNTSVFYYSNNNSVDKTLFSVLKDILQSKGPPGLTFSPGRERQKLNVG